MNEKEEKGPTVFEGELWRSFVDKELRPVMEDVTSTIIQTYK